MSFVSNFLSNGDWQNLFATNLLAECKRPQDNFTFKCHRSNGVTNGYQDIYAVNDIAFHPQHGTLATVGSDGRYSFWDKVRLCAR